jgi:hypothetical protein
MLQIGLRHLEKEEHVVTIPSRLDLADERSSTEAIALLRAWKVDAQLDYRQIACQLGELRLANSMLAQNDRGWQKSPLIHARRRRLLKRIDELNRRSAELQARIVLLGHAIPLLTIGFVQPAIEAIRLQQFDILSQPPERQEEWVRDYAYIAGLCDRLILDRDNFEHERQRARAQLIARYT